MEPLSGFELGIPRILVTKYPNQQANHHQQQPQHLFQNRYYYHRLERLLFMFRLILNFRSTITITVSRKRINWKIPGQFAKNKPLSPTCQILFQLCLYYKLCCTLHYMIVNRYKEAQRNRWDRQNLVRKMLKNCFYGSPFLQ